MNIKQGNYISFGQPKHISTSLFKADHHIAIIRASIDQLCAGVILPYVRTYSYIHTYMHEGKRSFFCVRSNLVAVIVAPLEWTQNDAGDIFLF